jgi:phosphoesterase RecJ-like protein
VLAGLELLEDGRVAVMRVSKRDFAEARAHVNDTENLINIPLQIRTVQVSVLMSEPPEGGAIRVSLRSKGGLDVAKFAEQFGGGGHARAAGAKLSTSLDEARDRIVAALKLEAIAWK